MDATTEAIGLKGSYTLTFPVGIACGPLRLGRDTLRAVPIAVQLRRLAVVSGDGVTVLLSTGSLDNVRDVVKHTQMP